MMTVFEAWTSARHFSQPRTMPKIMRVSGRSHAERGQHLLEKEKAF